MADSDPAPVDMGGGRDGLRRISSCTLEVLKLLLPMFFRMDLTASKNAYIPFRWVGWLVEYWL